MIVGIDPGNTGAIASLDYDGTVKYCFDLPLEQEGNKKIIDGFELSRIIIDLKPTCIVLEKVHAMPGQGVTSMFNFGQGYGIIKGTLQSMGHEYELITPQAWKGLAGLLKTEKDAARIKAIEEFPEAEKFLQRKKDSGRADAIWIGYYGLKKYLGEL